MKKPEIIMIANQKGGVGKTSCTIELGAALNADGYKVLLIDLDPQTNLTGYTDVEKKDNLDLKSVLDADCVVEDAVVSTEYFDVLPGNKNLSNATKYYGEPDDIFLLQDALDGVNYDFILLDSAPGRSVLQYMCMIAADYLIAPTEVDEGAVSGLYELSVDRERFVKRNQSHIQFLGILLNKYENTAMHKLSYDELNDVAKEIGASVFKTVIRKSIVSSEAKTARLPVLAYKPDNNIAKDYAALEKEMITKINTLEGNK